LRKDESKKLKDKIEQYHNQIDEYQEIATIYREIGDAIAFSYIDRWGKHPLK
jgi:predicted ribosome quality control (RQC) complex YloA/Tae2 family protein